MDKPYKIYLIAIIVLLLFIVGCVEEKTPAKAKPFIGGTDSVKFNFIEGAPPPEVYDGSTFPFDVTLNVENKGEYDIKKDDMTLKLVGFYPADFSINDASTLTKKPDEDLKGAYIDSEGNVIPGTVTYVNFPQLNYKGLLKGNNEFPIRADICYKYGTKAQADICILQDFTKTEGKVCVVNEKKAIQSSSSPIKIENFEESVAGTNKVTFSFDIVHRGTGAISKDSSCSDALVDKNKVKVVVSGLEGLGKLTCSGIDKDNYVALYGGKRLIRCTLDLTPAPSSDFEKKVYMNLEFNYKEHTETKVLVKHTTPGTAG